VAKKFYVVWKGRETGIFTDWASCKRQVDKFAGARYKSFPTRAEAEAAFSGNAGPAAGKSPSPKRAPARKRPGTRTVKTYSADEVDAYPAEVKVFTDGGCDPNPGQAGSGVALYRNGTLEELRYGRYNPHGTNNTAELGALLEGLRMAKAEVGAGHSAALFCDSKYSVQCIVLWAEGWEKKGWKRSGGEIKNLELIQQIYALYRSLEGKVPLLHVNGHVGVEGNELADRMSMLAVARRETGFVRYDEPLDVAALLAMRAG
jgi:ribonuclease HI